jgi:chromosomal replication initiation ATPase DnaA
METQIISEVAKRVTASLNVPYQNLFRPRGGSREEYVYPRQVVQTLLLELGFNEAQIADFFRQHRTTVYNSVKAVESYCFTSKEKREQYSRLKKEILPAG